jgi:superfamily II DNA/RNA helicase
MTMTPASAPAASTSFADLGVPAALTDALARLGIVTPTPIQAAALPDALAGRDVCGSAPTGTGKTLAFGLALLGRLGERTRARAPRALVLAPTRELAVQIADELSPLASALGRSVAVLYGGVGYARQLSVLSRGVDVIVATPGRLNDLVVRGDIVLASVEVVVVDEADRMADMGFLPEVRRLVAKTNPQRQTMLFSATFDGPVESLVRELTSNPARHRLVLPDEDRSHVEHHFWRVDPSERVRVTADVVRAAGPAVIFCRTRRGADRLAERLRASGIESAAIHGDLNQRQRERALEALRQGRIDALVATDVAARGIHVDDVPLVIHFDPAERATDYVHRSGRTGRAGASGAVVSLVGPRELGLIRSLQGELGLARGLASPDAASLEQRERAPRRARPERREPSARSPRRGELGRRSGRPHRTGPEGARRSRGER